MAELIELLKILWYFTQILVYRQMYMLVWEWDKKINNDTAMSCFA